MPPMPTLSENTSKEMEEDRDAIEASERKDPFVTHVSITIAVLAGIGVTLGSLESLETAGGARADSNALLQQNRATDAWNAFEAMNIKDLLQAAGMTAPAAGGLGQVRHPDLNAEALQAQAKEFEEASAIELERAAGFAERHHVLTVAVTLVQLAIAIATVSIITRSQRWPWYSAIGLGIAGVIAGAYAFI